MGITRQINANNQSNLTIAGRILGSSSSENVQNDLISASGGTGMGIFVQRTTTAGVVTNVLSPNCAVSSATVEGIIGVSLDAQSTDGNTLGFNSAGSEYPAGSPVSVLRQGTVTVATDGSTFTPLSPLYAIATGANAGKLTTVSTNNVQLKNVTLLGAGSTNGGTPVPYNNIPIDGNLAIIRINANNGLYS